MPSPLRLIPIPGLPEVEPETDLADLIRGAAQAANIELAGNVIVVCQKIVSKAEGRLIALADVSPSDEAIEIAEVP